MFIFYHISLPRTRLQNFLVLYVIFVHFVSIFLIYLSVYTVDANESAVILRLGKYHTTTYPGLQFKLPFIDSVYKVKVDYQYKKEFGFRSIKETN